MLKFILAFLISTAAFAAQPGAVPSVTVSAPGANTGQVSISPAMLSGSGQNGIFSLFIGVNASADNFYPFYKNGVAYQVTAGKTAYCFDITAAAGTANYTFQLVSATASIATGSSSITGGVYQCGLANALCTTAGSTASVQSVVPGVYAFGASTYPGIETIGTASYQVHMDCYEQ